MASTVFALHSGLILGVARIGNVGLVLLPSAREGCCALAAPFVDHELTPVWSCAGSGRVLLLLRHAVRAGDAP